MHYNTVQRFYVQVLCFSEYRRLLAKFYSGSLLNQQVYCKIGLHFFWQASTL